MIKYLIFISTFTFSVLSFSGISDSTETDTIIIAGYFPNNILDWNTGIQIEVEDFEIDSLIGKFESDNEGFYCIFIPKAGKYKFFVTPDGSMETYYAIIDIPETNESLGFLKQKMILSALANEENELRIENLFDDEVHIVDQQKALEIYRKK